MSNERTSVPPLPEPVRTRPAVVKTIIAAMVTALFIRFLIDNADDQTVAFLWWNWTLPLWLFLIMSALTGIVVWELSGYLRRRRR